MIEVSGIGGLALSYPNRLCWPVEEMGSDVSRRWPDRTVCHGDVIKDNKSPLLWYKAWGYQFWASYHAFLPLPHTTRKLDNHTRALLALILLSVCW